METIRTFIAFDTTPEQKKLLASVASELRQTGADVRWELPAKFHVTLKFLGDTPSHRLGDISTVVRNICSVSTPVRLRFDRLGCFPNLHDPRTIWAGCRSAPVELEGLKQSLDSALSSFGFESDPRRFHPHITLGRVKGMRHLDDLISTVQTVTFESFDLEVGGLLFMKSVLHREGSDYSVIESFPLGRA